MAISASVNLKDDAYPSKFIKISQQVAEERGKSDGLIKNLSEQKERNLLEIMYKNMIYNAVAILIKELEEIFSTGIAIPKDRIKKLAFESCRPADHIEECIVNYVMFIKSLYLKGKGFEISVENFHEIARIFNNFSNKKSSYNDDREIIQRQELREVFTKYKEKIANQSFYHLDITPEALLILDVLRIKKESLKKKIFVMAVFRLVLTSKDDLINYICLEKVVVENFEEIISILNPLLATELESFRDIASWLEFMAEIMLQIQKNWKELIFKNRELRRNLVLHIINESVDKNEDFTLKYIENACHGIPTEEILITLKEMERNKQIIGNKSGKKNTWKKIFKDDSSSIRKIKRGEKAKIVEDTILSMKDEFTFRDVQTKCPEISSITIRNILKDHKDQGIIECIPKGCNSRWKIVKAKA